MVIALDSRVLNKKVVGSIPGPYRPFCMKLHVSLPVSAWVSPNYQKHAQYVNPPASEDATTGDGSPAAALRLLFLMKDEPNAEDRFPYGDNKEHLKLKLNKQTASKCIFCGFQQITEALYES